VTLAIEGAVVATPVVLAPGASWAGAQTYTLL
jgi:hypothetical protein